MAGDDPYVRLSNYTSPVRSTADIAYDPQVTTAPGNDAHFPCQPGRVTTIPRIRNVDKNSRTIRETPRQRDGIPSYLDRYYPDPGFEVFMELETVTS